MVLMSHLLMQNKVLTMIRSTVPCLTSFPSTQLLTSPVLASVASLLFLELCTIAPASGPLFLLFFLPTMPFPPYSDLPPNLTHVTDQVPPSADPLV